MILYASPHPDEAIRKGATEYDGPQPETAENRGNNSFAGQLGHRDQDEMLKDNDTDFPEPDAHGEHTGH